MHGKLSHQLENVLRFGSHLILEFTLWTPLLNFSANALHFAQCYDKHQKFQHSQIVEKITTEMPRSQHSGIFSHLNWLKSINFSCLSSFNKIVFFNLTEKLCGISWISLEFQSDYFNCFKCFDMKFHCASCPFHFAQISEISQHSDFDLRWQEIARGSSGAAGMNSQNVFN